MYGWRKRGRKISPHGPNRTGHAGPNLIPVPLQGHWARQNSPLTPSSRREARVLLIAGALAAIATIAVCFALFATSGPAAKPGCKRTVVAMSTGGATIEHCRGR